MGLFAIAVLILLIKDQFRYLCNACSIDPLSSMIEIEFTKSAQRNIFPVIFHSNIKKHPAKIAGCFKDLEAMLQFVKLPASYAIHSCYPKEIRTG